MLSEASPLADLGPGSAKQDVDKHEHNQTQWLLSKPCQLFKMGQWLWILVLNEDKIKAVSQNLISANLLRLKHAVKVGSNSSLHNLQVIVFKVY